MGALIVLLSLLIERARQHGETPVAEQPVVVDPQKSAEIERLREQEEDLQWQADMLRQQREEFAKDLTNKRDELAHLEDHIRRLEDHAKKVIAEVELLRKAGKGKLADSDKAKQQAAELEQEIADKKKQLADARKEILRRRPAYAIVPYDGPHGTSRRPLYVECTEEGIVLQPEGVVLGAEDFQGPLGPGNPLDAALRASREYLQRAGLKGEPYPLIVVRPSGALAFGACRGAMKHWESEFGYELVDQDAEIKYPPADPQLAATLRRAVNDARQRQIMLASAMPNRFGAEGRLASFRAADNSEAGAGDDGSGSGPAGSRGGRAGAPRGVPSFSSGGTGMGTGPRGATGSGGSGTYGQGGIGDRASAAARSGRPGQNGSYGSAGTASGTGQPGMAQSGGGQPGTGGSSSSPSSQSAGSGPSGTQPSQGGQSYAGGSPGGNASSGSSTNQGAGATSIMSSGARSGSPGAAMNSQGGASAGSSGSSAAGQQSAVGATPSATASLNPQMAKARKALKNRGENWGLPNAAPKATAITRPIRVECYSDRLLLLPEKDETRTPLVVPIEEDLGQNLDAFVDAVWRHMDRWGLAVLGGYWKPILTVDVKPGGEERFAELQMLLRGSGMEVERKP